MNMMRLLFVGDHLGSGGAQRQLVTLALELTKRGHEIDFFLYHDADFYGDQLREAGIQIFLHPKPSRYSVDPVLAMRMRLKQRRYDLVLSFQTIPNLYAILARATVRPKPRLVLSERIGPKTFIVKCIIQNLYRFADHITVNSHHLCDYFLQRCSWIKGRISTIWNGVDLDCFRATAVPPRKNGPLKLLAVGRMIAHKNAYCLVRALPILRDQHGIHAQVDWVGRLHHLTREESDYFKTLQDTLKKDRLMDQWNWLGESGELACLFQQHHVLVHPSYWESLPNVVCEALACGRPVIASDTLEHPRLVRDGQTGFLFDWESPEELAGAINKFSNLSGHDVDAMGRKARAFAEQHLSIARMADNYESLFRDLVYQSQ